MKKVLLVCFGNLDDLVFCSGIASTLAEDGSIHLGLLCRDYTAKLGYLLPGVQQVFAADPYWNKAPHRKKGKFANFLKCLTTVRSQKFDTALLISSDWQAALAVRLAGIPKVYALRGHLNRPLLTRSFLPPLPHVARVGGLHTCFQSLIGLNRSARTILNDASFPQFERPRALQGKKLVVLHAFTGTPNRSTALEIWGTLARTLAGAGYHILWTGFPVENQKVRAAFQGEWDSSHFVDTWAQDLLQIAWIWREAQLFVGHDSGPLHVANALGVPVLGVYGMEQPDATLPQGASNFEVIRTKGPEGLAPEEFISRSFRLLEGVGISS